MYKYELFQKLLIIFYIFSDNFNEHCSFMHVIMSYMSFNT